MAELIPTRAPLEFTNAPPLLPGLIAALVWIESVTTSCELIVVRENAPVVGTAWVAIGRLTALTMPVVTVPDSPNGFPSAMTGSPTCTELDVPRVIGVSCAGGLTSRMTARSVVGSVPTTVAW